MRRASKGQIPARGRVASISGVTGHVAKPIAALNGLGDRLALVLPEHVFTWHRANGQSTIRIGTRAQLMAIGSAVLVAGWLGVATSSMISGSQTADVALAAKQAELARMQSQLTAMQTQTAAVQGSVATTAHELEARQAFLASLIGGKQDLRALAKMLPRATGDSLATARDLLPARTKVLEPFRDIANQQLAFVDQATGAAEAKLRDTEALIRRVGLDPSRFAGASAIPAGGVGGPYVPVSAPADAEPRFKSLYMSWQKLAAMQAAVASIPSYVPVKNYSYTSSFGVRYDPFNGGAAMHQGTDMAGAHGEPIYAAANGTVRTGGPGQWLWQCRRDRARQGHRNPLRPSVGDPRPQWRSGPPGPDHRPHGLDRAVDGHPPPL